MYVRNVASHPKALTTPNRETTILDLIQLHPDATSHKPCQSNRCFRPKNVVRLAFFVFLQRLEASPAIGPGQARAQMWTRGWCTQIQLRQFSGRTVKPLWSSISVLMCGKFHHSGLPATFKSPRRELFPTQRTLHRGCGGHGIMDGFGAGEIQPISTT